MKPKTMLILAAVLAGGYFFVYPRLKGSAAGAPKIPAAPVA